LTTNTDTVKALRISTNPDKIGQTNIQNAFFDLFGEPNTPGNFVKLINGKLSYDVLPKSEIEIQGWVNSTPQENVHQTTLNKSMINRLDLFLQELLPSFIGYGGVEYLLTGDLARPDKKLAYAIYGEDETASMSSSIYDENKKLIRVDYYADKTTFSIDGLGRTGYKTITYTEDGKIQSAVYTALQGNT